ncbi:MAG: AAA family ATPase [Bacteroidia bacterium]|nr:AAA family ATPase [Ignavibacteriaceae bacterium]MCK6648908.1 AAA family ATPase [Bacteroidia bacterium]
MKSRYSYIQLIDGKVHCGPIADLEAFLVSSIKFKFILKTTETDNIDSYSKLPFVEVVYLDKKLKSILPTVGTFTILSTENYQIWSSVRHFRVSVCDVNGDNFNIYLTSNFWEDTVKKLFNALFFINKFSSTTELKEYLQMEDKKGYLNLEDILKHTKELNLNNSTQIISEKLSESVDNKLKDTLQHNPWQEIIGLTHIKSELVELIDVVKVRELKKSRGLKVSPQTLHMVFTGNPGTGKTTIARLIAEKYKEIGVLKLGQLIEVDRSDLVAEYVGQTAIKTNKVLDKAKGGVLFIDEAYSLINRGENDYGKEVIDTLVKKMEDDRDEFVLIVAGYPKEMENFLSFNPGLASRFYKTIHFDDYSLDELKLIFIEYCKRSGYVISNSQDFQDEIQNLIKTELERDPINFGNARGVRKIFERVERNQNLRLGKMPNPTNAELLTITNVDIKPG